MNLRQLDLLVAVVERGGYLAAGDHAGLAYSAVHRQIKLLERQVGEPVLVRQGRGVVLTEVGAMLVDLSRRLNQQIAETRERIADLRELRAGRLRIGTGTTTLIYFLRTVLDRLRLDYPDIELHVTTGPAEEILASLQDGTLDVGIISEAPGDRIERGLFYRQLYRDRFLFVVNPDSPLLARPRLDWRDLEQERLICLTRGTRVRAAIDALLARSHPGLTISMELENEEAIVKMVELGFGVGVIAARRLPETRLRRCPVPVDGVDIDISAVVASGYVSQRVRLFLSLCTEMAAGLAPAALG